MDKFAVEMDIRLDQLYVVDGEFFGGVTRFMNHSCDPNCRQFTVWYNHADAYVYGLALFAIEEISFKTELTFNYLDREDETRMTAAQIYTQQQTISITSAKTIIRQQEGPRTDTCALGTLRSTFDTALKVPRDWGFDCPRS